MAYDLELTQSNYGRLEKDDSRLTVPKLQKIAEILQVTVSYLFNEQISKIIHQTHNQNPTAYNVENLYQENKEATDKLIAEKDLRLAEKDSYIDTLKEQISLLKEQIKN